MNSELIKQLINARKEQLLTQLSFYNDLFGIHIYPENDSSFLDSSEYSTLIESITQAKLSIPLLSSNMNGDTKVKVLEAHLKAQFNIIFEESLSYDSDEYRIVIIQASDKYKQSN
jgi:hypothetical protein